MALINLCAARNRILSPNFVRALVTLLAQRYSNSIRSFSLLGIEVAIRWFFLALELDSTHTQLLSAFRQKLVASSFAFGGRGLLCVRNQRVWAKTNAYARHIKMSPNKNYIFAFKFVDQSVECRNPFVDTLPLTLASASRTYVYIYAFD